MNTHVRDNLTHLAPALLIPAHQTGEYYIAQGASETTPASAGVTADLLFATPIIIPKTITYDRIAIFAGAGGSGTDNCRMGIYADNDGLPGALVVDGGAVAINAASTLFTVTISEELAPGTYWLAGVFDANTRTKLVVTDSNGLNGASADLEAYIGAFRTFTYAALPNPFGSPTPVSTFLPRFGIRAA